MRLVGDSYEPITPDARGRVLSQELDAERFLENGQLVMCDVQTGQRLLTQAEAAEAEIERLRQKLRDHGLSDG